MDGGDLRLNSGTPCMKKITLNYRVAFEHFLDNARSFIVDLSEPGHYISVRLLQIETCDQCCQNDRYQIIASPNHRFDKNITTFTVPIKYKQ